MGSAIPSAVRALVSLLALLACLPAGAEPRTNHRFHVWTERLSRRVQPAMRQNVDAVGCYLTQKYNWLLRPSGHRQHGTAFLVERSGNRGLVLTNAHVVRDQEGVFLETSSIVGAQIAFRPSGTTRPQLATVRRLVMGARHLDFALVEVDLPPGLQGLKPVQLSRALPEGARKVYTAGFPGLAKMNYAGLATALGPGTRDLVERTSNLGLRPRSSNPAEAPKTVQIGRLRDEGQVTRTPWGDRYQRPQLAANLPAFHGSSGSPVFDGQSGQVMGLLRGMDGYGKIKHQQDGRGPARYLSWNTRIVPMRPILDWIGQKLQQGAVPDDLRQRVGGLLQRCQ